MIRTFIAIDLSAPIKSALDAFIRQLKTHANLPVRWTSAHNIHVTLKFLGDVEQQVLPDLYTRLTDAVRGILPFTMRIGKLGAFPKIDRPRIIWVGCEMEPAGFRLQTAVEDSAAALGFAKEDRPFSPHLTIGRVSQSAGAQDYPLLAKLVRETPLEWLSVQTVEGIRVYRSDLLPGGSKYTPLHDISLGTTGQFMA